MALILQVDSRVRIAKSWLLTPLVIDELKGAHTHNNSQHHKLKMMGKPHWNEPRFITSWQEDDTHISFPRGCLQRVTKLLAEHGVVAEVHNDVHFPKAPAKIQSKIALYPYQKEAVVAALENEQGIVRAPTGSGKTIVFLEVAARVQTNTLVIIPTSAIFDQWQTRATTQLGIHPRDVGIIQGKTRRLRPLTLAMQKTLYTHGVDEELVKYFGCILCDEAQLFAARTFFEVVDPFRARYRLATTADHRRKDGKDFLITDLFGPVIYKIKEKALIQSGHVLDVEIEVIPTNFRADWYGMPENEDDEREIDWDRLQVEMQENDERNALVVEHVERLISEGEQVLVMCHRREHCRALDRAFVSRGIRSGVLIGGDEDRVEFKAAIDGIRNKSVRVGVGTFQAIGTGVDLPSAGVVVCVTPVAGNKQFFGQVRGRACRTSEGKKLARVVYMYDQAVFGLKHISNLRAWNKTVIVHTPNGWQDARSWISSQRHNDKSTGGSE